MHFRRGRYRDGGRLSCRPIHRAPNRVFFCAIQRAGADNGRMFPDRCLAFFARISARQSLSPLLRKECMAPESLYRSDSQVRNEIRNLQIDGIRKHMRAICMNLSLALVVRRGSGSPRPHAGPRCRRTAGNTRDGGRRCAGGEAALRLALMRNNGAVT